MAAPREENPIRNKPYVQSYDVGDNAFPILAVKYEPKAAGYILPAAYAHFTDIKDLTKYPNHVFVGSTPLMDSDQRVEHIYMILPGPWMYSFKVQERSGDVWIIKKRKNIAGDIIPNVVIAPSIHAPRTWAANYAYNEGDMLFVGSTNLEYVCYKSGTSGSSAPAWGTAIYGTFTDNTVTWMTIPKTAYPIIATEREDITDDLSWEVVTWIPTSQFSTYATALHYQGMMAVQFPALLNSWIANLSPDAAHRPAFPGYVVADIYEWYVISATKPDMSAQFTPRVGQTVPVGSSVFQNVLVDGNYFAYLGYYAPTGASTVLHRWIADSIPSYSAYIGAVTLQNPLNAILSVTAEDIHVVGTNTNFGTDVQVGDVFFGIYTLTGTPLTVATITDATHLTLSAGWPDITSADYPLAWCGVTRPGTGQIGNPMFIFAEAEPMAYALLWRCIAKSVIAR